MSILSQDEFFARINAQIGDSHDDASIAFLEDMTDTYNDMKNRIENSDSEDWKKKFYDNDAAWRAKYSHRFYTGSVVSQSNDRDEEDEEVTPENIRFSDIFKKE